MKKKKSAYQFVRNVRRTNSICETKEAKAGIVASIAMLQKSSFTTEIT